MDEGRGFTIIDYEDRYKQALEEISLPGCWNTTCWSRWIWRCWRSPTASCPAVAGCCWPAGGRRLWAWSCWSFRGRASASCSSSV